MSLQLINPSAVPNKKPRGGKGIDKARISTCKVCKLGVYDTEEHMWARGRILGICHTDCVQTVESERDRLLADLTRERFGGVSC